MKKRITSILTALALSLSLFPVWSSAAGTDGALCPHHPAHDGDCGYTAPSEGHPCGHIHTAACYTTGQLPNSDGYETGPDAQELLNCPHVHDADCGFAEANGGTDCGFVCNVCPTEALDEDGQGQIVIARSMELQAAPDETTAPVGALDLHDCTGGTSGSGYTWAVAGINEDNEITSGTLTLSAGFNATTVVLPDATVTIETKGECTIGELYVYGKSPQKTRLTISGSGTLTVSARMEISGGAGNTLTVNTGATLIAENGISIGYSGVNSIVTVNGKLTAKCGPDDVSAIYAGKAVVGNTGVLEVSGGNGMHLCGMNEGSFPDFTNVFTIEEKGRFTATCDENTVDGYAIMIYGADFPSEVGAMLAFGNEGDSLESFLPLRSHCRCEADVSDRFVYHYSVGIITTSWYSGPRWFPA